MIPRPTQSQKTTARPPGVISVLLVTIGIMPVRLVIGVSCRHKTLIAKTTQGQRDVLPAEPEAVAEDVVHAFLAGHVGDVIQIALGVGRVIVDGRGQYASSH